MKFKAGVYCGSRWYRISDWKMYGLFRKLGSHEGFAFSVGPILFWSERR